MVKVKAEGYLFEQNIDQSNCYEAILIITNTDATLEINETTKTYIFKKFSRNRDRLVLTCKDSTITLYPTDEYWDLFYGEWEYNGGISLIKLDV